MTVRPEVSKGRTEFLQKAQKGLHTNAGIQSLTKIGCRRALVIANLARIKILMHLHLIFVGKTSFPEIDTGINRYLERLRHFVATTVHIIKAVKIDNRISEEKIRDIESERILKAVEKSGQSGPLILWDRHGKQLDSTAFALFLDDLRARGGTHLWMIIGGPVGVSAQLKKRADAVLSLSRMTFPHDLARLMIMEQLYRGFSILAGLPYHR